MVHILLSGIIPKIIVKPRFFSKNIILIAAFDYHIIKIANNHIFEQKFLKVSNQKLKNIYIF